VRAARRRLGVGLARRRKLDEALLEFQAALRLSPTNESARRNIEQIQSLKARLP